MDYCSTNMKLVSKIMFDKSQYFSYFPSWLKFNGMTLVSGDSIQGLAKTGVGKGNLS